MSSYQILQDNQPITDIQATEIEKVHELKDESVTLTLEFIGKDRLEDLTYQEATYVIRYINAL